MIVLRRVWLKTQPRYLFALGPSLPRARFCVSAQLRRSTGAARWRNTAALLLGRKPNETALLLETALDVPGVKLHITDVDSTMLEKGKRLVWATA